VKLSGWDALLSGRGTIQLSHAAIRAAVASDLVRLAPMLIGHHPAGSRVDPVDT
jgi:hypothetical protein